MRPWPIILGGWLVWAAHFLALYAIGSIFPGQQLARWLVLVATLAALGGDAAILWLTSGRSDDRLERWVRGLGRAGAMLSLVAVIWQASPALVLGQ